MMTIMTMMIMMMSCSTGSKRTGRNGEALRVARQECVKNAVDGMTRTVVRARV